MSNSKNLVISSAFGYSANQISFFIKSLRRFYKDEIYFLISPKDIQIKDLLRHYDCKFLEVNCHKNDIQLKRYSFYLEILKNQKYNKILHCDSRDIYFQANPFEFKYHGSINFFLEDEKLKNCKYNSNWILKTYGKKNFKLLSDKIILCSGTIVANYESMLEYLNLLKYHIKKYKYKKRLKYLLTFRRDKAGRGCDQAHANYIGHNNLVKNSFFYKNVDGPIATVYHLKKIRFDDQLNLVNDNKVPYLIVHQYDKKIDLFKNTIKKIQKEI